jgi:mannose-6-phosphate isomerase-like protein (cupin superfamily)
MPYVDAGGVPAAKVPKPFERELKVVMSPETHADVDGFTLLFSTLAPRGGGTDMHEHKDSGELMVVVSGRGRAWLAGEEHELKPGAALYAPSGVEHRTLNEGGIPLELVCVFIPPAPADYIEKMIADSS